MQPSTSWTITRALIKTTDFFTPIVDDPWTYGAIAAANSMSDVYAMGGDVILCLNIAGFPEGLDSEIVVQIFAGGAHMVKEAGAAIAGGHTVTNPEPFYGLSVTGIIDPRQIMTKSGARPGNLLFLTKPLGTGVITTAAKLTGAAESRSHRFTRRAQGKPVINPVHLDAAVHSMLRLNRAAAQAAQAVGVRGATDITGFGLLGHGSEMAVAAYAKSGAGLRLRAADVPVLPGVWDYIDAGYLTRGSTRNPQNFGEHVRFASTVTARQRTILWEAETSGGLLLAVPQDNVERFRRECAARGQECWEIGDVTVGRGIEVL